MYQNGKIPIVYIRRIKFKLNEQHSRQKWFRTETWFNVHITYNFLTDTHSSTYRLICNFEIIHVSVLHDKAETTWKRIHGFS